MSKGRSVSKAELRDWQCIADILGDAFSDDPVISHAAGRVGFAYHLFESLFRNIYASLNCSFYVTDEHGTAMGCALLAKPGQEVNKYSFSGVGD